MIKATTTFKFYCPHCKKDIEIKADFNSFQYTIDKNYSDLSFLIYWEGSCPHCDEWIFDVKL